jgi:2-oxoglutarate dehydrogenase E2 component (dihydrolipoamide succinyltransferase)
LTVAEETGADGDSHRVRMSRTRRIIARRMVESLQSSAQLTTVVEVDVTALVRLRQEVKDDFLARVGVKLSYLPFLAVAAMQALRAYPIVNASLDPDEAFIEYHDAQHLGVAVDTERGLLVPVVHDAGALPLAELAVRIDDLAARARANRLTADEVGGGTFTITNTGSRGALFDTPIVNPPQSAILGTGAVVRRAVPVIDPDRTERFEARSLVYLALSYDHRIIDGADAARFLGHMRHQLEDGDLTSVL